MDTKQLNDKNKSPAPYTSSSAYDDLMEFDVPADGTCLFYCVMLSVLLPTVENVKAFTITFLHLFGEEVIGAAEEIRQLLLRYDGSDNFIKFNAVQLEVLADIHFRKRVVNFIRNHQEEFEGFYDEGEGFEARLKKVEQPKIWGDETEIQAISDFLNRNIIVWQGGKVLRQYGEQYGQTAPIHLVFVAAGVRKGDAKNHYHFKLYKHQISEFAFNRVTNRQLSLQHIEQFEYDDKRKNIAQPMETLELKQPTKKILPQILQLEKPITMEDIISGLPESERPSNYAMDHLLAAGFCGTIYQLLVLQSRLLDFLAEDPKKDRDFSAMVEAKDHGNLDDIVILLKEGRKVIFIESYQIKYYNHPIAAHDFYNSNKENKKNKIEKMHIGKFFDGWLKVEQDYPSLTHNHLSILYTNTTLDDTLEQCIFEGRFSPAFLENGLIIRREKTSSEIVHKSFLSKAFSKGASEKVWDALLAKKYIDQEGYFTAQYVPERLLDLKVDFGRCKKVTEAQIQQSLLPLHASYQQNQINLNNLLYQEAWAHLQKKGKHLTTLQQDDNSKRILFRRFLESFRFQITQPSIEYLISLIQEKLKFLTGDNASNQVFLSLYYAIHHWFLRDHRDQMPCLNTIMMRKFLQEAIVCSQYVAELQGFSGNTLTSFPAPYEGRYIIPDTLSSFNEALNQPGIVHLIGQKGIGKSNLIKLALEKRSKKEYLVFSVNGLLDRQKMLLDTLSTVAYFRIIIIDSAEAIFTMQNQAHRFKQLIETMSSTNRTVVLAIASESIQPIAFNWKHTCISVNLLKKSAVLDAYPELDRYKKVTPLINLARIPFYLSAILRNIRQMGNQQFDRFIQNNNVNLESELVMLVVKGQNSASAKIRRNTVRKLALELVKVQNVSSQGAELKVSNQVIAPMVQEGILVQHGKLYNFSHDLFFEHALIFAWQALWKSGDINSDTRLFWSTLDQCLQATRAISVFAKWFALNAEVLTDDIIEHYSYLKSLPCFNSILALPFITHNKRLLTFFIESGDIPLNKIFYNFHHHTSATPVQLAIYYGYPEGLTILLEKGASLHHPNAGLPKMNGRYTYYSSEPSEESSQSKSQSHSSSNTEEDQSESIENSSNASNSRSESEEEGLWDCKWDSDNDAWVSASTEEESDSGFSAEEERLSDFLRSGDKYWSSGFYEDPYYSDEDSYGATIYTKNENYQRRPLNENFYLFYAAMHNQPECLTVLLAFYENRNEEHIINLQNECGETTLHMAASNHSPSIITAMIQKDVKIDAVDAWEETPLHNAAYENDITSAKILLENGADPNAENKDFEITPLHIALLKLNLDMARLLLDYGAKLTNTIFSTTLNLSVADFLGRIMQRQYNKKEVDVFIISLVNLLNYGRGEYYDDEEQFSWGTLQHSYCDENTYYQQRKSVKHLADLILRDESCITNVLNPSAYPNAKWDLRDYCFRKPKISYYSNLISYAVKHEDLELLIRLQKDLEILLSIAFKYDFDAATKLERLRIYLGKMNLDTYCATDLIYNGPTNFSSVFQKPINSTQQPSNSQSLTINRSFNS